MEDDELKPSEDKIMLLYIINQFSVSSLYPTKNAEVNQNGEVITRNEKVDGETASELKSDCQIEKMSYNLDVCNENTPIGDLFDYLN